MNKMNSIHAALLLVAVAVQSATAGSLAAKLPFDSLHGVSWQDSNEARLNAMLGSDDAATALVRTVLTKPAYTYDYAKVTDFRFVDVEGNGHLSLVCRMNTGGAEVNSLLAIITPTSDSYKYDVISSNSFEISDISAIVVDLRHDGRKELLVRTLDDMYKGARPMQTFTHVYKIVDGKAYMADTEFSSYYTQTRIPEIQAMLRKLSNPEQKESPEEESYKRAEAQVLGAELVSINARIGR